MLPISSKLGQKFGKLGLSPLSQKVNDEVISQKYFLTLLLFIVQAPAATIDVEYKEVVADPLFYIHLKSYT